MTRRRDNGSTPIAAFFSDVATVPDLLERRVELTPTAIAFVHRPVLGDGSRFAGPSSISDARPSLRHCRKADWRPESRIGILAPTSVDWEVCQMAALRCGAVVVGLDPYYPDALLNELIESLDPGSADRGGFERHCDRVAKTMQARMRMTFDIALPLVRRAAAMTDPAPFAGEAGRTRQSSRCHRDRPGGRSRSSSPMRKSCMPLGAFSRHIRRLAPTRAW